MADDKFQELKIKVDGQVVTVNLAEELGVDDLDEGMSTVAAHMAYWGNVWASAEQELQKLDAVYRRWRAAAGQAELTRDPKQAEWKVKQNIESTDEFTKLKTGLALAQRNVTLCRAMYESFRIKANTMQSKGAMRRAELDATGMSTKRTQREDRKEAARKDNISAMRAMNRKRAKQA